MLVLYTNQQNTFEIETTAGPPLQVLKVFTNQLTCESFSLTGAFWPLCNGRKLLGVNLGDVPAGQYTLDLYTYALGDIPDPATSTPLQLNLSVRILNSDA